MVGALTRRSFGGFFYPDSRSKTACRATPASASGGGYSEQGLAQRSKKSRKSGSPKIFSGTARGVAKQFRAILPLPLENPRNPSNCKGFGNFPFCQKSSKCSKICRKIAAKVVQILYMRGEIVGNSAAGKMAANPAIPTVYSAFSFRPPGEPVGKKHGKP